MARWLTALAIFAAALGSALGTRHARGSILVAETVAAPSGMSEGSHSERSQDNRDEQKQQIPRMLCGLTPDAGLQSNSISQTTGAGSNSAISGMVYDLPEPPLVRPLPPEARLILTTGPPFELLRPV